LTKIVKVRRYGSEFNQNVSTNVAEWENLNNLIDDDENYAASNNITKSSSPNNKPAVIEISNFNFDLPEGVSVVSVRVGYNHYFTGNLSIAAPLFKILGGYGSAYGNAVPDTSTDYTVYRENTQLSVSEVNDASFGVRIEYPSNTSTGSGDLFLDYVWIEIGYVTPTYFLQGELTNSSPSTGEEFNLVLNIANTNESNNGLYQTYVDIQLPTGITYVSGSGEGVISLGENKLVWSTLLTNNPSKMTLVLNATGGTGEYKIICTERSTSTFVTKTVKINEPVLSYKVDCSDTYINPTTLTDNKFSFNVKVTSMSRLQKLQDVLITLPTGWTLVSSTPSITLVTGNQYKMSVDISTGVSNQEILVQIPNTPGNQSIIIEDQTFNVYVLDPNYTTPFYSYVKLDSETIEKLEDGVTYTVASYVKVLERDNSFNLYDGNWNYRMGIVQAETFDITKCRFTGKVSRMNTYIRKEIDFTYDSTKPVFIVWTGGYVENTPEKVDILFTEPCIVEKEYFTGLIERALFPTPLQSLLSETDSATIILPAQGNSGRIRFSDINFSGLETLKNIVLHEIKLDFYLWSNLASIFNVSLSVNKNMQTKTQNIPVSDGIVTLGDDYDIWNFNHSDLRDFTDLNFDVIITNPYDYPITLNLRDFELEFKYINDTDLDTVGFSIDGDQCQFYGIFLEDRDLGFGVNSTVKEHREDGSDNAIEYLMNVKSKDITLTCYVDACTHEEAVILIDKFVKLVTNERDKNNKPIYKQLRLDDMKGRYWNYLLESEIDDTINHGQHKLKMKFVIPDGCAYSDTETVSGASGKINSIEKVNPIILFKANSSEITLNETKSNQSITIRNTSIVSGDIIRINCKTRTVERIISDTVSYDITSSVDLNSDFFSLIGNYFFDAGTTGTIQSVTYREAL
jgi:hypothetical protein